MFGSRFSLEAASSNRCIIDSNGFSSLISFASSTKALGIDFLRTRMLSANGEHSRNEAKSESRLLDFTLLSRDYNQRSKARQRAGDCPTNFTVCRLERQATG